MRNKEKLKLLTHDEYLLFRNAVMYVACILILSFISKKLIEYPVYIAYKYNIELSGEEYVKLFGSYKYIFFISMILSICAIPIVKLVNRVKKLSKDGGEFYPNENQNTNSQMNKSEVSQKEIQDLIDSNDDSFIQEKKEEELVGSVIQNQDNRINLLKCKNIKNHMKPLTQLVTMELYNHSKENITMEITTELVKNVGKRGRKKLEDKNKEIAKNIIEFLNNNDIIESDDMLDDKYYFTSFGSLYMNYFSSGII